MKLLHIVALPEDGSLRARAGSRDGNSVGRRAAAGAIWIFLGFAAGKVLNLGINVVLARLLVPADFGLVSFAMIMIGAFTVLQGLGVPDALIYSHRDVRIISGTALTINVGAAVLLFAAAIAAAPIMVKLSGRSGIAPVTVVLAASLVVLATGSVQDALMSKEMAFRRKFGIDITSLIVEGAVAVTLAYLGFGVWSLVLGYLANTTTETLLLWCLSSIRPLPRFDSAVARHLLGYGKHVSFNALVTFGVNNIDFLVIGYFLGSAALGVYTLAFNVSILPAMGISQVVRTAMFPAYTRIRDHIDRLLSLFEDVFIVVWSLSIAVGLGVFICAPPYMSMLLGPKWAAIATPLRILAIYGTLRSINWVFPPAYKALGHPNIEWKFNLVRLGALVPAMLVGVRFGIEGIAVVQVLVSFVFVPLNAIVFARVIDIRASRLLRFIAPQLVGATIIGLVVAAVYLIPALQTLIAAPVSPLALSLVALALYAVILHQFNDRLFVLIQRSLGQRPVGS